MTEPTTPAPPPNGATPPANGQAPAAGDALTVDALVDRRMATFTKKINDEQAALRTQLAALGKGQAPAPGADPKPGATDPPMTPASIRSMIDAAAAIGRLEGSLPEAMRNELEGDDDYKALDDKSKGVLLRRLAKTAATETDATTKGQAPGAPATSRAAPATRRAAVPSVSSQSEFVALKKSDPKKAHELLMDDSFDLARLPFE